MIKKDYLLKIKRFGEKSPLGLGGEESGVGMSGSGSVDKFDTVMNDVFGILDSARTRRRAGDRTKTLAMFIIGIYKLLLYYTRWIDMKKTLPALLVCALLFCPCVALAVGRYSAVRLIVSEYALEGGTIEAGAQAVLKLTVRNTNAYQGAGNIVFTIADANGEIVQQGPSGVYVEEIPRGGEREISFLLLAAPDALPGYAKLCLSAEYETADGQAQSMQAELYVEISQEMRLEYGAASLPTRVTEGDNVAFTMDFCNMGKGTVYNVLMRFAVPGLNGGSAVLVGNIEPGDSKTGRANLLASAPDGNFGETQGVLTLSWEDASGAQYAQELPLSTVIAEETRIEQTASAESEEEEGVPAWLPGVLLAVAGIGLVIWIQILLEKRRQRERDEKML